MRQVLPIRPTNVGKKVVSGWGLPNRKSTANETIEVSRRVWQLRLKISPALGHGKTGGDSLDERNLREDEQHLACAVVRRGRGPCEKNVGINVNLELIVPY